MNRFFAGSMIAGSLAACIVLAGTVGGRAEDVVSADAAAAAIVAALAARGDAEVSYTQVTADGDTIVLTDLESVESRDPVRSVTLPAVRLAGVAPREAGGFFVDRVDFDDGVVVDGNRTITWGAASVENVVIPTPDEVKIAAKLRPFARIDMEAVRIDRGETTLIEVADLAADVGPVVKDTPASIRIEATGARVAAVMAGSLRRQAFLESLGYDTLALDLEMQGSADLYNDVLALDPLILRVADFGDVTVEAHLTGVSVGGFIVSSRRSSAREEAKINRLSVHFDNGGLVERALDMQASMMGVERDQFVEQFLAAVPFMLNFVGNPPFQAKLAVVAADFLREPKSLTLDSAPKDPVSLDTVVKTAADNRGALPDLLAVEVTANQ